MPAPVAKGIIVTASVLVAAGIALYQSPQFQRWVNNSRRKIALALYNMGDEIFPHDERSPLRQDASMTEETGEAAEERRRIVREEILHRRSLLEERQRKGNSQPLNDFDSIVDKEGKLKSDYLEEKSPEACGSSTAVDISNSQLFQREINQDESAPTEGQMQQPDLLDTVEKNKLHIDLPSDVSSNHPSESLVDLTPTSEAPDSRASLIQEKHDMSYSGYFSVTSESVPSASSHTEHESPGFFYAHLNPTTNESHPDVRSPFADPQEQVHSSAASTAGSYSHLDGSFTDASSDGTLSEIGREGTATPASWSEVGSVISDDLGHHY